MVCIFLAIQPFGKYMMCYRRSPQWQARRGCCSGRHAGRACGALEALTLAGLLGALEAGGRLTRSRVEGDSSRELRPFAHDPRASMRSAPCVPVRSVFPLNKVFADTLKKGKLLIENMCYQYPTTRIPNSSSCCTSSSVTKNRQVPISWKPRVVS